MYVDSVSRSYDVLDASWSWWKSLSGNHGDVGFLGFSVGNRWTDAKNVRILSRSRYRTLVFQEINLLNE